MQQADEQSEKSFDLERKWVKCQRFLYVAESVAAGGEPGKARRQAGAGAYERLRAAENGTLGKARRANAAAIKHAVPSPARHDRLILLLKSRSFFATSTTTTGDRVGIRWRGISLCSVPPAVPLVDRRGAGHPWLVAPLFGAAAEALAGQALQRQGGGIAHVAVVIREQVDQFRYRPGGGDVADDAGGFAALHFLACVAFTAIRIGYSGQRDDAVIAEPAHLLGLHVPHLLVTELGEDVVDAPGELQGCRLSDQDLVHPLRGPHQVIDRFLSPNRPPGDGQRFAARMTFSSPRPRP